MRSSISKLRYRPATLAASFSTAGGRGRGGAGPTNFPFSVEDSNQDGAPQGRGRGTGVSSPVLPSFTSFVNNGSENAAIGRGRGRGFVPPNPASVPGEESDLNKPAKHSAKLSFLLGKDEGAETDFAETEGRPAQEKSLPIGIFDVLVGAGRGKPGQSPAPNAETRQTRAREQIQPTKAETAGEQLSNEEKVRKAVGILSRGEEGGPGDGSVRAEGGGRVRADEGGRVRADAGGRGRGRGGGERGRGRGRGRRGGGYGGRTYEDDRYDESADEPTGKYFGDPADEEKVAKKLGPELMSKLAEGFEEMSSRILPSPYDEALLDAYETNLMIECEPEYFMEEFGTNPDIDDKPPIPLRDALEKMKPFLMAYEGIQSQEEWEEIIEETMKTVPLMKSIVDHYGGPDRVTAKQQKEELERVAKTLPASTPASVKRFTDRAVLSLQSNPGWGFDKKCIFMDKLIMEVSQQYK